MALAHIRMISVEAIRHPEVRALAERATTYLAQQRWCGQVERVMLGHALAGIIGVFHITFRPRGPDVDPAVWVIVGDLPPAYIAYAEGDTWQDALHGYVYEMQAWVNAGRAGDSTEDLIPVDVEATPANVEMLATRLAFLRERLLAAPDS